MRTGGILLVTAAVLTCTACLGDEGKLEIRSVNGGLKPVQQPVPYRIAEARGQLAIGNVALALEGFRKAEREDPTSIAALAGMGQCYDLMGRFDVSRRHYERALALAPRDPALLAMFAASLDRQGLAQAAGSVRREIAALAAADQAPAPVAIEIPEPAPQLAIAEAAPAPVPQVAAPVGQSVTIALPPPRPADVPKAQPATVAAAEQAKTLAKPLAKPAQLTTVAAAKPPKPQAKPPQAMAVAPVGRSVTIALPPPRPAPATRQPRLERLSMSEVALITGDGPRWKRPEALHIRAAARRLPDKALEVRLLNAARVEKLAARTRAYLGRFGWNDIAVGDANAVRRRSLIVYPKGAHAEAARLSKRLGIAMAPRSDVKMLTILLGRDAAANPALQPKA